MVRASHAMAAFCSAVFYGYFVDVQIKKSGAHRFLFFDQVTEIDKRFGGIVTVAAHGELYGDFHMLDPAFVIILGRLYVIGDGQEALLAGRGCVGDGLPAIRVLGDMLAFAQAHPGGVNVFTDDDK